VQNEGRTTRYPTVFGDAGDQSCGWQARLYCGNIPSEGFHDRKFIGRDIVFFRPGEQGVQAPFFHRYVFKLWLSFQCRVLRKF
jgi:hypothetical protein